MTPKRAFLITARIVLVFFFIILVRESLIRWDEYSYYMTVGDIIPDLSLAVILWFLIGLAVSAFIWLFIYSVSLLIPGSKVRLGIESILLYCFMVFVPLFIKKTFFPHFSFSYLFGVNRFIVLLGGGLVMAIIIWFTRKNSERIMDEINSRIAPIVWIFVVMFIISIPVTLFIDINPVASGSSSIPPAEGKMEGGRKPNILLVVMDTLTAEDMELYGYRRPTTPFISKWADDAAVFERVYADASYTTPATMSLLTGQRQWIHRTWYYARYSHLENYDNSLPEILKDNGYRNYAFVQNDHAHPDTLGMRNAFALETPAHDFWLNGWWYDGLRRLLMDKPVVEEFIFRNNPLAATALTFKPFIDFTLFPSDIVFDRFLKLTDEPEFKNSGKPFFAYIHVYPPHARYIPPKPFRGTFADSEIIDSLTRPVLEYSPEEQSRIDKMRIRYDEFILYADKKFEIFIKALKKKIDLSNTIIILTADHGESFEHGYQSHGGPHLFNPFVRVPLIIMGPGIKRPSRIDINVDQVDIAPTILGLAGIPTPEWMEGRSMVSALQGNAMDEKPVFSMYLQENSVFKKGYSKGTFAVWFGRFKLIYYLDKDKKLLFDLQNDPGERNNIAETNPEVTQQLFSFISGRLSSGNK